MHRIKKDLIRINCGLVTSKYRSDSIPFNDQETAFRISLYVLIRINGTQCNFISPILLLLQPCWNILSNILVSVSHFYLFIWQNTSLRRLFIRLSRLMILKLTLYEY